jgi:hypothetical protein
MPSHQDRVKQNNCEHDFKYIAGVDVADLIIAAKMCSKCDLIVKLGTLCVDKIEKGWVEWYNKYA